MKLAHPMTSRPRPEPTIARALHHSSDTNPPTSENSQAFPSMSACTPLSADALMQSCSHRDKRKTHLPKDRASSSVTKAPCTHSQYQAATMESPIIGTDASHEKGPWSPLHQKPRIFLTGVASEANVWVAAAANVACNADGDTGICRARILAKGQVKHPAPNIIRCGMESEVIFDAVWPVRRWRKGE